MSPTEFQIVKDALDGLSTQLSVLRTKLLGDDEGENSEGRLPRLEAGHKNHGRRIARLEALVLMITGAVALVKVGGYALEALAHISEVIKH